MALPASGPISGSQIGAELSLLPQNLSLGGMISSSSLFTTTNQEYSEFYGYSAALNDFTGSLSQIKNRQICNQSLVTSYWHNGSSAFPVVGDTIYTNSGGTATIGGGSAGYVKLNDLQYSQFNSSGVVITLFPCII